MPEEDSQQIKTSGNDISEDQSPVSNSTSLLPERQDASTTEDISIQTTGNMEVHHHPHLHTSTKGWTKYLFEFFLIFFAVILGFLFENLREHYVEHQRAKKYAQALFNDLMKDGEAVKSLTNFKNWRSQKLDSLIMSTDPSTLQANAPEAYYYSCFLGLPDLPFRPSDITIQQLRNSGSLRYFSLQLINSITQYYSNCNFYAERENEHRQITAPFSLTAQIFDADQVASFYSRIPLPDIRDMVNRPDSRREYILLPAYQKGLNEYRLYVSKQKRGNDGMIMMLHGLVERSRVELVEELKKEYNVK